MRQFDLVALARDLPEQGLEAGAGGTVIEVCEQPQPAYEVQFAGHDGVPIATVVLRPDQLR
jgi:Domain of unknown function (DUF4926)